jgi:hypothetical protein
MRERARPSTSECDRHFDTVRRNEEGRKAERPIYEDKEVEKEREEGSLNPVL